MNFYHILFALKQGFNRNLTWYENLFVRFYNNTIAKLTAKILRIKGNTVSFNQLVQNGDFSDGTTGWSARLATVSVSNGIATVIPSSTGRERGLIGTSNINCLANHKYYISVDIKSPIDSTAKLSIGGSDPIASVSLIANIWKKASAILEYTSNYAYIFYALINESLTTSQQIQYRNAMFIDITLMEIDNLTTPEQVETWLSNNIGLLPYYDYTPGTLIPFTGTGLKTTGKNLVANTLNGCSINSVGQIITDANFNIQIAQIIKGETYIIKSDEINGRVCGFFYDIPTLNSVSYDNSRIVNNNMIFVAPISGYIAFRSSSTYSTPQCEFGSTATAYEPYTSNTLSLPTLTYFPFGEDRINNVYDELTNGNVYKRNGLILDASKLNWTLTTNNIFRVSIPNKKVTGGRNYVICSKYPTSGSELKTDKTIWGEYATTNTDICIKDTSYSTASGFIASLSGVQIAYALETPLHNYGVVDLGTLDWKASSSENGHYEMYSDEINGAKPASSNSSKANIICSKYLTLSRSGGSGTYNEKTGIAIGTNGYVYVYDSNYNTSSSTSAFKTAMSGVYLLFELANPVAPSLDLTYPIQWGGTEQILPVNTSVPTTSGIVADIKYPDGTRYDQTFVYRVIEKSTQLGNRALSIMLGKKVETDNPEEPLDILLKGEK